MTDTNTIPVFENGSPCRFDVTEQVVLFPNVGRPGESEAHEYKALVRTDNNDCLSIVGKNYKLVQNEELFEAIAERLPEVLPPQAMEDVRIIDNVSYEGAECFRQYMFPNFTDTVDDQSKLVFRILVKNCFGLGAVKLILGAIDSFCWNGMISGVAEKQSWRHTQGIAIDSIVSNVELGVQKFEQVGQLCRAWQKAQVPAHAGGRLFEKLVETDALSQRSSDELSSWIRLKEFPRRGRNVWAVYSGFTQWASHQQIQAVRNTRRDNTHSTMIKREERVRQIIHSKPWNEFVGECGLVTTSF